MLGYYLLAMLVTSKTQTYTSQAAGQLTDTLLSHPLEGMNYME